MLPYLLIGAAGVTGYLLFSSKGTPATAQAQAASNATLATQPTIPVYPPATPQALPPASPSPPGVANTAFPNDGSWGSGWSGIPVSPVQGGGTGALPNDGNWYDGLSWSGLDPGFQGQTTTSGFFDPLSGRWY